MSTEVIIESEFHHAGELRDVLGASEQSELDLEIRQTDSAFRFEPTVLVAIISGGFTVVTTLITTLLPLLRKPETASGVITVETAQGARVEVPAGTSADEVERLIALAEGRVTRITIEDKT